jgi:dihydrofolate reductase
VARNVEIKARIENVGVFAPVLARMATSGPLELAQDDTFFHCETGRLKLRAFSAVNGVDGSVEAAVRALKAQPGKDILTDGSSVLVPTLIEHDLVDELQLSLYPVTLGGGKRILPGGVRRDFQLTSAAPYPTGVVGLRYARRES